MRTFFGVVCHLHIRPKAGYQTVSSMLVACPVPHPLRRLGSVRYVELVESATLSTVVRLIVSSDCPPIFVCTAGSLTFLLQKGSKV
jgi:hypothetical protein